MVEILEGRTATLVILAIYCIWILVCQYLNEKEIIKPTVRRIAIVDSIDDAIDRTVELGRGIQFTTGAFARLDNYASPSTLAGLQILGYIAKKCADKNVPLISPIRYGYTYPMTLDVCESAFKAADKTFDPTNIRYYGDTFFNFALGMYHDADESVPGAWFAVGAAWDELAMVPVHLMGKDVFCIGGSSDLSYQSCVMMGPDDWMIGEELYAVANYVSGTKEGIGSMLAADWSKIVIIIITIIGIALPQTIIDLLSV